MHLVCREYCHEFITSFVAHLCLPSNVTNTMHAIADGHNQEVADVFIESLNQDKNIKVSCIFCGDVANYLCISG